MYNWSVTITVEFSGSTTAAAGGYITVESSGSTIAAAGDYSDSSWGDFTIETDPIVVPIRTSTATVEEVQTTVNAGIAWEVREIGGEYSFALFYEGESVGEQALDPDVAYACDLGPMSSAPRVLREEGSRHLKIVYGAAEAAEDADEE